MFWCFEYQQHDPISKSLGGYSGSLTGCMQRNHVCKGNLFWQDRESDAAGTSFKHRASSMRHGPKKLVSAPFGWTACVKGALKIHLQESELSIHAAFILSFSLTTLWKKQLQKISSLLTQHLQFCAASALRSRQSVSLSVACVQSVTHAVEVA